VTALAASGWESWMVFGIMVGGPIGAALVCKAAGWWT
jgi:hypothetical protein